MTLDYKILWFEDEPAWYEAILTEIEEFLKEIGFLLESLRLDNGKELNGNFDEYDLILIDYNLLGEKGDDLIENIRNHQIFTDIIFYSQAGEQKVRDVVKEKGVDGVFCAGREQDPFLEKVFKVIKTTIKKVEDINNVRGLVMAHTSELDRKMEEVVNVLLANMGDDEFNKQKDIIKDKFISSFDDRKKRVEDISSEGDITTLLKTIESIHKWRAVKRLIKNINELSDLIETVDLYDEEVIKVRNCLAHVTEETDDSGKKILIFKDFIFNDEKSVQIRKNLKKHSDALDAILKKVQ